MAATLFTDIYQVFGFRQEISYYLPIISQHQVCCY